ncbi:hypothetical protein OS493_008200 [Desmophyllum pertusum]|uniref:HYR domain-containing protein n=1 Tax=Desmophyllum pertusum TaxID=174260 RepID=A0A9X0A539_9CNID|nr:hypothetical protein OS493_008200 [Desmophyllum pertusum]
MVRLQMLTFFVIGNGLSNAFLPARTYTWKVCSGFEWRNDWAPAIPQGQCVKQYRYVHYSYTTHFLSSIISISPQMRQGRTMCSCTHAYNCPFHAWSGWSGSVSQGTCGKQSRYRDYDAQIRFVQVRVMLPWGWSSWADLPSPVSGHCASQQRTRSYDVSWLYTERLDNCNGVEPLSCPSPQVENREKDIGPPSITCPNSISVPTDPGKPTATVSIPKASATDNSGQLPTITNNAGAESKEFIVSSVPHEVRYTATDAAGLSASCTLQITVSDKERPRVSSCPPDIKKQTEQNEIRVTWDYPVFEDNFDVPPVQLRISSNRNPGALFPWGRYHVVYTASDRAGNKATCEFYVEVGPVACTYFEAPAYGARACNKKTMDSNGVTYEMLCAIQCREGYTFAEPETPNTFMCQSDGTWFKLLFGQSLVPVFPKTQRPWPDCAPEQNVDSAKKNYTFYTGSCSGNDEEALARIRENFLNAVKDSPLADYLLCDVSQGQDCVLENIKVYCGENSRKRSIDERIITFDFVIRDKKVSSDRKVQAAKYVRVIAIVLKHFVAVIFNSG